MALRAARRQTRRPSRMLPEPPGALPAREVTRFDNQPRGLPGVSGPPPDLVPPQTTGLSIDRRGQVWRYQAVEPGGPMGLTPVWTGAIGPDGPPGPPGPAGPQGPPGHGGGGIDEFDPTETYGPGDLVIHNNQLYLANTGTGPGAFVAADWDQMTSTADLATALADYLPLAGGTLSGPGNLSVGGSFSATGNATFGNGAIINGSPNAWALQVNANATGNYGLYVNGYTNVSGDLAAGGTLSGNAGVVARSGYLGIATGSGDPFAQLLMAAQPNAPNLINASTGALIKWRMYLGDGSTESGGNAGANFAILNFDDLQVQIGTPLSIERATGDMTLGAGLIIPNLPTTDPGVSGALWNNGGVVNVSP